MRIIQSPCRTSTKKPVKITLKAMQLANAIIAGLKSDATTAVCVACRALWIKKAIIAKYETIIASTNRNRRVPNLLAVARDGTNSVVLCKLAPRVLAYLPRIFCDRAAPQLGSDRCRHQTFFRDSHIFFGDWRTVYFAFSGSADCVA
jgi:hypothetical protein